MRKKISLIIVIMILVLTVGCSKKEKIVFVNEQKFGSAVLNTEMTVTFKNGYLESTETVLSIEFEAEETAESFADAYRKKDGYDVKVDGTKVKVKNVEKKGKDSSKEKENKKEEVIKYLNERGFTQKK